jgi:hypothetical protein
MNKHIVFGRGFLFLIICLVISATTFPLIHGSGNEIKGNNSCTDPYQYYTYQEMTDELFSLQYNHSEIMAVESIGETYEGRDIWLVKLSDNVQETEEEPGVLFMGAHHGNEKPSFEILIFFIQHMVENYGKENIDNDNDGSFNEDIIDGVDNDRDGLVDEDPSEDRVRNVINSTQIFIIPMVNPDGVEADSRKNCAPNYGLFGLNNEITSYGVNLNRNYDDHWFLYYIFPINYHLFSNVLDFSYNYRGLHPFSENETKAVRDFVETQNISISLSFHSYGEFMIFPWMHTSKPTPDEDLFLSIGENISHINKYYLHVGGNYIIPRYAGTIGSSENWLYRNRGILSFTVELCAERAPINSTIVYNVCLIHVGVNLYICERSQILEKENILIREK